MRLFICGKLSVARLLICGCSWCSGDHQSIASPGWKSRHSRDSDSEYHGEIAGNRLIYAVAGRGGLTDIYVYGKELPSPLSEEIEISPQLIDIRR